jgi:hypothetical protein
MEKKYNNNHSCTNFPKIRDPPQNSRRQKRNMKQVSYWGPINIGRHPTKCSRPEYVHPDDDGDHDYTPGDSGGDNDDNEGEGGEDDHNDKLICLLGQQNCVTSAQERPGTMLVIDTAVEGACYTARAAEFWGAELFKWLYEHAHAHAHAQSASDPCTNPQTCKYKAAQTSVTKGHNRPREG